MARRAMDEGLAAYQRINSLSERSRQIVSSWVAGRPLVEIGAEYGISKQRVHQIVQSCRPLLAPFTLVRPDPEPIHVICTTCGAETIRGESRAHCSLPTHYFWPHVKKTDGCWLWTGPRYPSVRGYEEYGRTSGVNGISHYAHRESYRLHFGPVPDGMSVCHTCDNPPCVNPDHLFAGSQKDNAIDRDQKGRTGFYRGVPVCRVADIDSDVKK